MYRRNISTKFTLFAKRVHPSFTRLLLHDDDGKSCSPFQPQTGNFLQHEFHRSYSNAAAGFGDLFRERRGCASSLPVNLRHSFCSFSSSTSGNGDESDKIEYMTDVATVFTEKSMEAAVSQGPVVSEVAVAAADSSLPVAALQFFIEGVHNLTGFNWWAAIALTTIFIRSATVPLLINQLKSTSKLSQMRPHLEEIKQQMQDSMDPKAMAEAQKRMKELFKEYGVNPLTPLKGLFIQGPIFVSFFFAITNMAEKVPSFKGGGAFWFSDLSTPDSLYIFPVLTALTFLLTVELNMQEGLEGNPIGGTMKNISRIFALLSVPLTMNFPKAIFCYWVTSNIFSLFYCLVIKCPPVKKLLGLPEIVPTTTSSPHHNFSLFGGSKPLLGGSKSLLEESMPEMRKDSSALSVEQSKPSDKEVPSSSNVSQRFTSLEMTVKGRRTKKN